MTTELDLTPDLASQQWWDDTWVDVVAGGSISTPTLAWRYFATSIFIDHETDNWNLHVQFSEDPSFDWARMSLALSNMYGKQYRFHPLSQPGYWVLEKVHKTQRDVRNDLGRMETVVQERVVDIFVVVERKVMKCSTLYDLANVRMLGAIHSLSTTLTRLGAKTPAPNVRTTTFWQSATLKIPDESIPTPITSGIPETATAPSNSKARRKRPDPFQMSILHAVATTQAVIPGLLAVPGDARGDVRTSEEERAERFMSNISGLGAGDVVAGGGGGVKRRVEEAVRGVVKQARFEV
ncbi:hypothetical protein QFC20_006902 [Naganishia adeliensis]|uniref:Uncharacterized protein n=1 Tax=Naganishia adeliensis TaxID=92952 RepID=A0ACC2V5R6_9TREE|nr:hypothetical protein QFC20_006902 [Naganishia adeliensis]